MLSTKYTNEFCVFSDIDDCLLFDEFGIYEESYPDWDDDPYYDDMFECNGVDYY